MYDETAAVDAFRRARVAYIRTSDARKTNLGDVTFAGSRCKYLITKHDLLLIINCYRCSRLVPALHDTVMSRGRSRYCGVPHLARLRNIETLVLANREYSKCYKPTNAKSLSQQILSSTNTRRVTAWSPTIIDRGIPRDGR